MQQLAAQVPWGHNIVLMDKIHDNGTRKIYLQGIIKNGWGRSMLVHQIEVGYHLRCYVVVELKTTEFKPEYIGQLGFYVTAVDETLKKESAKWSIGLLLCKEKDKISVE